MTTDSSKSKLLAVDSLLAAAAPNLSDSGDASKKSFVWVNEWQY